MTKDELTQRLEELIDWELQDATRAAEWVEGYLAEMREALEAYRRIHDHEEFMLQGGTPGDRIRCCCPRCRLADKALSAAPKRGEVLWDGRGHTYWSETLKKLIVSLPTGSFDIGDEEIPRTDVVVRVREEAE